MERRDAILEFWFGELTEDGGWDEGRYQIWFMGGEEVDATIRDRFGEDVERAARGEYDAWKQTPRGALALILLFDQFTRNIWRGSGDAFQYDHLSRALSYELIGSGSHRELHPIERTFVYMPLEHTEELEAQRRCVELFEELEREVPEARRETFEGFTEYARKHLRLIERFGRFPHRNELLGREPTPEERAYLEDGGETFGQSTREEE